MDKTAFNRELTLSFLVQRIGSQELQDREMREPDKDSLFAMRVLYVPMRRNETRTRIKEGFYIKQLQMIVNEWVVLVLNIDSDRVGELSSRQLK
jgi:hypothetical protein